MTSEKQKQYNREYFLKNKEKIYKQPSRRGEKRRKYFKKWKENNKDKLREYKREWMRKWRLRQGMKPLKESKFHKSGIVIDIFEEERNLPKSYKEYLKKAGIKLNSNREFWS